MRIKIPYQYEPREYQLEFHKAPQRFKVCVFHRRAGKSKMALNEQIRKIFAQSKNGKNNNTYYYILPTYRQAKSVIWDSLIKEHVPMEAVKKLNESELAIYWKNGAIQRFVGCEDIDKHRGINPVDVVFDEYSEMNEEIWTAIIRPVLAENKGTATFIFTPKGRNHSWKLLVHARENPNQWFQSVKTVDDTDAISAEEMEIIKKDTPQALIDQEYYCNFLDDAGAFFRRVRENVYEAPDAPEPSHVYQLGVDLAKYQDWTVITPFDLNTFKVGIQERFNQIDWNLQKSRIEATARRYNNGRIVIDSTGVGDPITEDLERIGLPVEPFKFTEKSKRNLLDNLAIMLEQDRIKIPNDEGLLEELLSMKFEKNKNNKTVVAVPSGMTDDRIMSLALSVWDARQPVRIGNDEEYTIYNVEYN